MLRAWMKMYTRYYEWVIYYNIDDDKYYKYTLCDFRNETKDKSYTINNLLKQLRVNHVFVCYVEVRNWRNVIMREIKKIMKKETKRI